MPHHKSAEKPLRQTEKRTATNRSRLSRVRTFVKNVESAIETGDKTAAQSAFDVAQPALHRATTKGVMHQNTDAHKLSRPAARINALGARFRPCDNPSIGSSSMFSRVYTGPSKKRHCSPFGLVANGSPKRIKFSLAKRQ